MSGFEADVQAQYPNDAQGYAAWRQFSASKLPAGVFVWRDEFEKEYCAAFNAEMLSYVGEREGDRDMTYTPMLAAQVRDMALAGFNEQPIAFTRFVEVPENEPVKFRALPKLMAEAMSEDAAEAEVTALLRACRECLKRV